MKVEQLGPEAKAAYLRFERLAAQLVAEGTDQNAVLLALSVLGTACLLSTHGRVGAIEQTRSWITTLETLDDGPSSLCH